MNKTVGYRIWLLCFLIWSAGVYGQELSCGHYKSVLNQSFNKTSIASPEEDQYDVKYVKLDISLNDIDVNISGCATTTAVVVAPSMYTYVFELTPVLTVDSVFINGIAEMTVSSDGIRRVVLSSALANGDTFTAKVYYHGTAEKGNGYFTKLGLNQVKAEAEGINVTYTLSEPYMSKDWWPCKQSLQDKIDSAAIWVTIPGYAKAGSNGLLRKITPMPGGMQRYEWHTQYPMAYYLLSVAVAKYKDYSYKVKLPGVADEMLVQNYIYDVNNISSTFQNQLDSTAYMLQYFSEIFGVYPFYKEKYGHCIAPLFGGMEHQTMSTCGNAGAGLVAHELAHQWFGDYVTCATWKDIWLNEGFASYAEYLFYERYRGKGVADSRMNSFHNSVLDKENGNGTVYGNDTTSIDRIFSGRLSYNKPAAVLHMLRYEIANDSLFFAVLKTYLQNFANRNASTNDFLLLLNAVTGKDWTYFINQWIYNEGAPAFSLQWNKLGNTVFMNLQQRSTHPASVAMFNTLVDIKLIATDGDTTIRLRSNAAATEYQFSWNKTVRYAIIDPDNKILNRVDGVEHRIELGANTLISNTVFVYPNPAHGKWVVVGAQQGATISITDITGRVMMKGEVQSSTPLVVDGTSWSSGIYMMQVRNGKNIAAVLKLIKQ